MSVGIKIGKFVAAMPSAVRVATIALTTVLPGNSPSFAQESNERWMTMGRTNDGAILSLDVNSIQSKPHAGNWLWFAYRITDDVEAREHIGFTGSCERGQLVSEPEWQVENTNERGDLESVLTVKADSPGTLKLGLWTKKIVKTITE
ncbi:MAG: hypothetical protein F6K41_11045 [Symploca sp. SIO3E6]|nr:hypothetical protein [Caldora sp. SIO3E6]